MRVVDKTERKEKKSEPVLATSFSACLLVYLSCVSGQIGESGWIVDSFSFLSFFHLVYVSHPNSPQTRPTIQVFSILFSRQFTLFQFPLNFCLVDDVGTQSIKQTFPLACVSVTVCCTWTSPTIVTVTATPLQQHMLLFLLPTET